MKWEHFRTSENIETDETEKGKNLQQRMSAVAHSTMKEMVELRESDLSKDLGSKDIK